MRTTSTLICLLFLFVTPSLTASPSEIQALNDFYYSTYGRGWNKHTNWLRDDPCENAWHGVKCDAEGNIIGLDLYSNSMQGTIPDSFGLLSNLETVIFDYNRLYEELPVTFSNLTKLKTLDVHANYFTGPFPQVVFDLPNLQTLDLSFNTFNGQLPEKFEKLPMLKHLILENNRFSGSVPYSILNNLRGCEINLGFNQLSSIPWKKWTNKDGLSKSILTLSHNRLTGSLSPQIYWALSVDLFNNSFSGSLPDYNQKDGDSKTLSVNFGANNISGNLPVSLTGAPALQSIDVSLNHQMEGEVPIEFATTKQLCFLNINGTLLHFSNSTSWDSFRLREADGCPVKKVHEDDSLSRKAVTEICLAIFVACVLLGGLFYFFFHDFGPRDMPPHPV